MELLSLFGIIIGFGIICLRFRHQGAGESAVKRKIESLIKRKSEFGLFNGIILKTPDGTTQIDHILISPYGIFVIETKNFKGWIFGDANQKKWTQSLYKNKFQFQNPIHQNFKHVKAVQNFLNVNSKFIFSIVVFAGNSRFMTDMPENVMQLPNLLPYIEAHTQRILSDSKVEEFCQKLEAYTNNTPFTHNDHMRNIKENIANPICSKCGIQMVLRTVRGGNRQFWGCSNYPTCRSIKSLA